MSVSAGADRNLFLALRALPRNVMGKVQKGMLRHEHKGLF